MHLTTLRILAILSLLSACFDCIYLSFAHAGEGVLKPQGSNEPRPMHNAEMIMNGTYSCQLGMDCIFYVYKNRYVPHYSRGDKQTLNDFMIIGPRILLHKTTGLYYCNIEGLDNEMKSRGSGFQDSGYRHVCTSDGWRLSK
jgi:hypothetical protein